MPAPEELAWLAAILDLKGHIIRKNNKTRATPQLVLMVESTQLRVIEKLCHLTGTSVEPTKKDEGRRQGDWKQRGCTEHCPEPHVHHEGAPIAPVGRWTVTGAAAAVVLHNVIPYMVTDRGLGTMRDELMGNLVLAGPGSGATKAAIRRLAQLGWDLPQEMGVRLLAEADEKVIPIRG
jgi:hypothetical protein